jgi:DNA-binding beta-propeller fold protein YncE
VIVRLVLTLMLCSWVAAAAHAERIELVAGGDKPVAALPATKSELDGPFGIDFAPDGSKYLVEISGGRVLKIDSAGILTRIAGANVKGSKGDGGPALDAEFNGMHSLAITPGGDLYIADTWNHRVRKINLQTGLITNVVGTDERGFSGDGGSAIAAKSGDIYCIALGPDGKQLYLADLGNKRIRKVDLTTGVITTVAGNGEKGIPKDGADAATSPLVDPRAVAVDSQNNVYILERTGNALRVVDPLGKIRTVVGTGAKGYSGDGGDAKLATMNGPKHLCVDRDDNVLIADAENHVVRKYLPKSGKIVLVAGTGKKGSAGVGGPPEKVELNRPHGVSVDKSGTIYIVDSSNNRVLKIVP